MIVGLWLTSWCEGCFRCERDFLKNTEFHLFSPFSKLNTIVDQIDDVIAQMKITYGMQQSVTVLGLRSADSSLDRIKPSRTSFTALLGKYLDTFLGKTFEIL